jgi:hypothetical protein
LTYVHHPQADFFYNHGIQTRFGGTLIIGQSGPEEQFILKIHKINQFLITKILFPKDE